MQLSHFTEINLLSDCNFPTKMKYSPSVPYYHSLRFLPFYSVEIYWICLRDKADIKWSLVSVPYQTFFINDLCHSSSCCGRRRRLGVEGGLWGAKMSTLFLFFARSSGGFILAAVCNKECCKSTTNHDPAVMLFFYPWIPVKRLYFILLSSFYTARPLRA